MGRTCKQIRVYGVVQGVGFRYFTEHQARKLGLTGYVRNMPDGSVEVLACGTALQVEALLDWIRAGGSPHAEVSRVETYDATADAAGNAFTIRY